LGEVIRVSSRQYAIIKAISKYMSSGVGEVPLNDIAREINVNTQDIMRDLAELEVRGLVKVSRVRKYLIKLTDLGREYLSRGLPEYILLKVVNELRSRGVDRVDIGNLITSAKLSGDEFSAALGILRRFNIVKVLGGSAEISLSNEALNNFMNYITRVNELLSKFVNEVSVEALDSDILALKRRGIISVNEFREVRVALTDVGREAFEKSLIVPKDVVTRLTPELIVSGRWRDVELKEFDLSVDVPTTYPVRKHPYIEFLSYVREVVTSMGFEEVKGPHVELELWNFDILYVPQYHPARMPTDVYIIKDLGLGRYVDEALMSSVREMHESGRSVGSLGWGYRWDPKRALRLVLRTHTTSVSMRTIYERGRGEYRCFSLDRVFRPDTPDPTHLMEFHQLEGIIVGKGVTFKHLLGFFTEFAKRLGLGDVLFRPAYFPFTEPSVEGYVKHPKLGWIEVFPGGMFRPEVLKPLNVEDHNVAAWGIGIDRIAMMVLGIDDIRDLYTNSIELIRKVPPPRLVRGVR